MKQDLTGKIFGRLQVISSAPSVPDKNGKKKGAWLCLCECGNEKIVLTMHLTKGDAKSCGCASKLYGYKLQPGMIFGRLTTISYEKGKWTCSCSCGGNNVLETEVLISGNTQSCGCFNGDSRRKTLKVESV